MSAITALYQWCKLQCVGYRDVNISNMTTSFRDGLAFCAIIHKHRPDLIDYDSLNKEDVFDNNHLAFRVAEDKLGIPALLDAEDMVALKVPDRLSILTYVSQYYNYFNGRNPIGGVSAVKRPADGSKEEPRGKKNPPPAVKICVPKTAVEIPLPPCSNTVKKSPKIPRAAVQKPEVLVESSNRNGTLTSKCVVCKGHVHLVQRHFIEGKLYHRSCFKCSECSKVLLAGAYITCKEPGSFICTHHQTTKHSQKGSKPSCEAVIQTAPRCTKVEPKSDNSRVQSVALPPSVLLTPVTRILKPVETPEPQPWTSSAQKTQAARQRFFQSGLSASNSPPSSLMPQGPSEMQKVPLGSKEDKIRARAVLIKKLAEANCNNNAGRGLVRQTENRFDDVPSSAELPSWRQTKYGPATAGQPTAQSATSPARNNESHWLNAVNKAGARPETISSITKVAEAPVYWRSKLKPVTNGHHLHISDSEEDVHSGIAEKMETNAKFKSFTSTSIVNASCNDLQTPSGASNPPPPIPRTQRALSVNQPRHSSEGLGTKNGTPPLVPVWHRVPTPKHPQKGFERSDSTNGSYSPTTCQSPKPPQKPSSGSGNGEYFAPTSSSRSEIRSPLSCHIPKDHILTELHLIEEGLGNLEREGVDMEKRLRSCEEEGKGDNLMDPLMVDWFKLIRKKQMYIRRESELVYIARTQDLEEQQPGVEGELRRLLEKPDHLKSSEERQREGRLMERLMEIVNGRNAIVEGLDKDRLREVEEDQRLNGIMQTLGITNKIKKSSSFKKLFRRRSFETITVTDQDSAF